jgi:hypothetical protein
VSTELVSARQDWEQGYQRLVEESRDPARADALHAQVDAVGAELRRRVGGAFSLEELARAYRDAEPWIREAVAQRAPSPDWPRTLAMVADAAFHLYARGAVDYQP